MCSEVICGSVRSQFDMSAERLRRVLKAGEIKRFNDDELDVLVRGVEELDWEQLGRNGRYSDGCHAGSRSPDVLGDIRGDVGGREKQFLISRREVMARRSNDSQMSGLSSEDGGKEDAGNRTHILAHVPPAGLSDKGGDEGEGHVELAEIVAFVLR
jgi:hypothetical protein